MTPTKDTHIKQIMTAIQRQQFKISLDTHQGHPFQIILDTIKETHLKEDLTPTK